MQDELKFYKEKSVNRYYKDGLNLVKNNNISKALKLMEKSLEDISDDTQVLNLMGLCEYVLCNFERAILNWNKSLMFSNDDNRARYYLDALKDEEHKNFIEYYGLAVDYIDSLRYREAMEILFEVNKTNRELIEPYALIARSYYGLKEYELAKEYLEQALIKDRENSRYLQDLNQVNNKLTSNIKNKNITYSLLFSLIAFIVLVWSLSFHKKYRNDIQALSAEIDKNKSEYTKLQEEFKKEKEKSKKDEVAEENTEIEKEAGEKEETKPEEEMSFKGSQLDILKDAMSQLGDGKYKEAIARFQYLIDKSSNEDIKAESLYFMALSFQNIKEHEKAGEHYRSYIDKYRDKSYYDDSLYNYGLMLYEKGDLESAKKILNRLKKDEPQSEFMNSKVRSILEN